MLGSHTNMPIIVPFVFTAMAAFTPILDLERARTKLPRSHVVGTSTEAAAARMNVALTKSVPAGLQLIQCEDWELPELSSVLTTLFHARNSSYQAVYESTADNRRIQAGGRHTTDLDELRAGWAADAQAAQSSAELTNVVRDARCYDAIMWWVHHVPNAFKDGLVVSGTLRSLPLLPTVQHTMEEASADVPSGATELVAKSYTAATGCAACHVNDDPQPTSDCTGSPDGKCPIWPREFSAPFALHAKFPSIANASSTFYYKFDDKTKAQLVDYSTRCFPFVSLPNLHESKPCKLLFLNRGIFLMQPALGIDCCTFVSDVGAVPPKFLRAFTYKGTNESQPDMYGNQVRCDHWDGPQGFKYWTVSHFDSLYHNWGHDIVFQDGPTGVTWRWGNFDVTAQPASLFELPSGADCSKTCSKLLAPEHHEALAKHVRIASLGVQS